ncbi:MAG TPA: pyrroline-5-carboxylate reductase [Ktedonosporobacter sp.]|nr:pyrroline-5-carboxylate reductase [Ktedonosporobacter sp.]
MLQEKRLFFLGAGSMSEAIIKGIVEAGLIAPQQIVISNRNRAARLQDLGNRYDVRICQNKEAEIAGADIIVLAMKPFDLVDALSEVSAAISARQLVISVAAGVSTAAIEQCLPEGVPVIRSMPNTSSFVQASATAISQGTWATSQHIAVAQAFFSAIGISVVVAEKDLNAVTGLSGTGPAYIYYVVEALMEAGLSCGLSADTCRALLEQTVYGAAQMLRETGKDPAELRRQVTSPNGTTMAAMTVLEQGDAQRLFIHAMQRATQRAAEMGQQASRQPIHS